MDVKLTHLAAKIPVLQDGAVLTIDAKASAEGQQVTELMLQSDLADSLGVTLQKVQVSGELSTDLHLHIPLTGEDVVAKGEVHLAENEVLIADLDLMLAKVSGDVAFVNDEIFFDNIDGLLLNQKVDVEFTGAQKSKVIKLKSY
ncbi:DUF3971 domain-containing protein [Paraglaciecola aquimarina]|uniref:DUF3971 domain-containing protein n=1 Tax=Paraglaciecola aquimarina TaxID=1235557 RepID=A0ABU3SSW8_9ALTE|nr:DUF3971 domain-containing protein [Paraglaciecola aquimarina]MDU0353108.1 DUF3971 domain-containing protein [Paraglaciecola aquimarina]